MKTVFNMGWFRDESFVISPTLVMLIGLTFLLTFLWMRHLKRKEWLSIINQMPGPSAFPLLEHSKYISGDSTQLFHFVNGLGYILSFTTSFYCFRFGPVMRVMLVKATAVEAVLSSNKHLNKSRDYKFLHPWLGTGLLTSTGKKWHSRRKLLTPTFHFKILEDFVEVFNSQSQTLVKKLGEKAGGRTFDISPFITLSTLDIICETAMGRCINAQENSESEYVKAVSRMATLLQQRMTRPWQHPEFLFKLLGYDRQHKACLKVLHEFTSETIKERRRTYQEMKERNGSSEEDNNKEEEDFEFIGKKRKRLAFLDLLLETSEEGVGLTNQEIQEEVDTFMFEGHDTTTAAINWFIYFMGVYPQVQAKVHAELDSVFGESDRPVTMADFRELGYLDCCIKESLRLYPSVPYIAREIQEDMIIENYRIPAGSTIQILNYRLHRDPEQFPNPEVFDPDRFLPDNSKKRHPYAYVPFSAGPRNCIGQKFAVMEEKVILSSILRKYRVESVTRREDLKIMADLILRPEDGNIIKLYPRTTKLMH